MNNFSPHMLKTFKECPKKYYYKYAAKISVLQKATPFEKGKKVHALANYYLRGDDITKLEKVLTSDETQVWNILKSNDMGIIIDKAIVGTTKKAAQLGK